ncbi:MAG: hypothetical protein QHG99_02945 [Methanomicrobiales archaeon]|nr:hypothetical protein [Methanomicrobiales archaeon]
MNIFLAIACALLVITLACAACGKVIQVPEDESTLEAALKNATEGDLILIGPGYYTETLDVRANVTIAGIGRPLTVFNITGGGYNLTLVKQRPIPDYHYLSYGLVVSMDPTAEGELLMQTTIPSEEVGVLDPLSIGFYRIEGDRVVPLSTTYALGREVRVTAGIDRHHSGMYAILGRRWFPFWPAIQGITVIMLVFASLLALYFYRRRRVARENCM